MSGVRMRRGAFIAVLAAALLTGCGEQSATQFEAQTEGLLVDVNQLVYQVQISRYLNPNDQEDGYYLRGLSPGTAQPGRDEVWFGVFMRVKNYSDATQRPATDFEIKDTEGNSFRPVSLDPKQNDYVYQATPIPSHGVLPSPQVPAGNGPIGGELILFRLKAASLQNRPLQLHISQGAGHEAVIDIDL